jgi:hypothetical protein
MGQKLDVVDASELTDADWPAVNRANRAYEAGGIGAFRDELEKLDDVQAVTVASAFFPDFIRALLQAHMAEHNLTIEDLREALKKAEDAARYH